MINVLSKGKNNHVYQLFTSLATRYRNERVEAVYQFSAGAGVLIDTSKQDYESEDAEKHILYTSPLTAQQAAEDMKDAKRYRWLRKQSHPWGKIWYSLHILDEHIDKAIEAIPTASER